MKFHNTLNPKLWDKWQEKHIGGKVTYHLKKDVAAKLKEIANAFIEYLEVDKDAIKDVVITGSSASFNYTSHSDLDLHLKVDYDLIHEDCPIVEGYLWALKSTFNKDHDISIYGIPVEVYGESIDSDTVHNGLFSLWNMRWIDEPKPIPPTDNDMAVKAKYEEIKEAADRVKDSEVAEQLINKIYEMRKAGLQEVGEFSTENLAFKKLRDAGVLDKLKQMKKDQIDKELSLESYKESTLLERSKADYMGNDNKESYLRNFFNLHQDLIDPSPKPYSGDRDLESILYFLGSKDGLQAKVKTPIETIIFNERNLNHLLYDNEMERLNDLAKIKQTLIHPNLIIETQEGKTKHNYIKAFQEDSINKAQLVVVKVAEDGTFYVTTFRLKDRKFRDKLKEGQIIYDLSDTYASKHESLPYTHIITYPSKFVNRDNRRYYMKNESIDTDLLKRDEKFRYMMLDRMRQDCNYYLEHPHEKHLWAGNVEDQIETMKQLYNSLPEKPEWLTMEEIEHLEEQMLNLKNDKNEDVNTLCDKIDNVEKDLEDMVKLVKPQVLMKNEAYNKLRKVVCEALEEPEFGEFKVGSKVKIGNAWNVRQGTITNITNDVATVEIEETPDNMARTDKFYLQDLQLV